MRLDVHGAFPRPAVRHDAPLDDAGESLAAAPRPGRPAPTSCPGAISPGRQPLLEETRVHHP
jgi:hypothetical protein